MSATSLEHSALAAPDPRLRAVVVIPARDEERRIAACLRALADQEGVAKSDYEVILVLDGCRDATAEVIAGFAAGKPALAIHTVELTSPQGVGRARRCGMDIACERLLELGRGEGLVLSTDADSVVAGDWLAAQLALVAQGARAIGGHIELDPIEALELSPEAVSERELRSSERLASIRSIPTKTGPPKSTRAGQSTISSAAPLSP
jgi:glucosyl-3-phosphoglycerate synthase